MTSLHKLAIVCPVYGSQIFEMIISALEYELTHSLHYPCEIVYAVDGVCTLKHQWIILFGSQHLRNLDETLASNRVIVYNLEQLIWGSWDDHFRSYANKAYAIWDYSQCNIEYAKQRFGGDINPSSSRTHLYVPLGFSAYFQTMTNQIDDEQEAHKIAFLGNMSDRRRSILDQLSNDGLPVDVYDHHYFEAIRRIMKTHSTLINLHFHDRPCILEVVRILPWVCQRKRVISERSCDPALDAMLSDIVDFVESGEGNDAVSQRFHASSSSNTISPALYETFEREHAWSASIGRALETIRFKDFIHPPKVAIATLHCNNRTAIFEVIPKFAEGIPEDFRSHFTWVVFSQGCSDEHNDGIEKALADHGFTFDVVRIPNNMGWSRGMNGLYSQLHFKTKYDLVLHLEDDWLLDTSTVTGASRNWLEDCLLYMMFHPEVSTLFLRKYVDDQDKHMYGWTRSIPYLCFKHPNPFNYASKIKTQPKISYRGLTLRRIPEFLYSANPTIIRLDDYIQKGVLPFPEFQDTSERQGEWKTTTMDDAPQWGYSEGLSMEKIRDLVCMNVNHGFFYHRN